jgi:homoserine kinase type II
MPALNADHITAISAFAPVALLFHEIFTRYPMSVYTKVEPAQLEEFLRRYELGEQGSLRAIAAGITNTNYYLQTDAGEFVLTLYEHHSDDELDFILGLQQHLAGQGINCASPVTDRRGGLYSILNHRPAAIIHRVAGGVIPQPQPAHCSTTGEALAQMHLAGQNYDKCRPNPRGLDWCIATVDMLDSVLTSDDRQLINATISDYARFPTSDLPRGAIHADLFHDNVLFQAEGPGGIIDFDYACNDSFVFDIAIMLNDWGIGADGKFIDTHIDAILEGYQSIRPLLDIERQALPLMLRAAALRFWLSRLYDSTFPLSGELTYIKSPEEFRKLLVLRSDNQPSPLFSPG